MNLVKNFLKIILGNKDTMKVRRDLQRQKHSKAIVANCNLRKEREMMKLHALYVLTTAELEVFVQTIKSQKMPTRYSSTLEIHIWGKKFGSLKVLNYHVLMQQIMLLALWGLLKPGARMGIMWMCKIFRRICTKVDNPANFESLQVDVAKSMALLEMAFPPLFFNIMTHLLYHLVQELDLCGPVSTRWMYPIERYLKTLKGCIQNMARLEASMAKGYKKDECIGFVIEYLQRFYVMHRRVWDAEEEYYEVEEALEGVGKPYLLSSVLRDIVY
jgi:hypothetical protein